MEEERRESERKWAGKKTKKKKLYCSYLIGKVCVKHAKEIIDF